MTFSPWLARKFIFWNNWDVIGRCFGGLSNYNNCSYASTPNPRLDWLRILTNYIFPFELISTYDTVTWIIKRNINLNGLQQIVLEVNDYDEGEIQCYLGQQK